MSGAARVRLMNLTESETRPVLGPAGNKSRSAATARKPTLKLLRKVERAEVVPANVEEPPTPAVGSPPLSACPSPPSMLRRQELLLQSNLSFTASCSSDCSTASFRSRASTGRVRGTRTTSRQKHAMPKTEKIVAKLEKLVPEGISFSSPENFQGKMRCSWVTPNVDACYAAFHDKEWGVPVHDDKKLFELLVLSGALAELTWPTILSKRHLFREAFMDFDPLAVSKMSEKKITTPGSTAGSLLSEPKLRAIIVNACQILKIIEEFGSFDRYCWSFVNHKPLVGRFRYPRQVPVKTPKADTISKDLMRRGFRCVGPTIIYSFMQVSGITNDHLIYCYRFDECCAAAIGHQEVEKSNLVSDKITSQQEISMDLGLAEDANALTIS